MRRALSQSLRYSCRPQHPVQSRGAHLAYRAAETRPQRAPPPRQTRSTHGHWVLSLASNVHILTHCEQGSDGNFKGDPILAWFPATAKYLGLAQSITFKGPV